MDPSNPDIKSCLSLVIVSNDLYDSIDSLKIDNERLMTPHRSVGRNKRLVYTDHYSLLLTFKDLPTQRKKIPQPEKHVIWNTNKPGAWDEYKAITDEHPDIFKLSEDDIHCPSEFNDKFEKIMKKVKYKAFGKVTFANKTSVDKPLANLYDERAKCIVNKTDEEEVSDVEGKIASLLIEKQRNEYEKKLKALNTLKTTKGKSAAVFDLKAKILGYKKSPTRSCSD